MKYQIFLPSLLIFSLSFIPTKADFAGNPQSNAYIRRDNNRCESIPPREVVGGIGLIHVGIRGLSNYPNLLMLLIACVCNNTPKVKVQSLVKIIFWINCP